MKKLFLTLAIVAACLASQAQNLLTFEINSKVLISTGDSIPTGAVASFNAHVDNVGVTGQIAYDINWYYNLSAKESNLDKVFACTDRNNRVSSRLVSYYQSVSDPTQVSYATMSAALKTWLESIYGVGNVTVVPIQE